MTQAASLRSEATRLRDHDERIRSTLRAAGSKSIKPGQHIHLTKTATTTNEKRNWSRELASQPRRTENHHGYGRACNIRDCREKKWYVLEHFPDALLHVTEKRE